MARAMFEKLEIYLLAEKLADRIWDIVLRWSSLAQNTFGGQMIRAADSIGANIAEGAGKGTPLENRRFLRIARGSFQETQHWLRRAFRRKLLSDDQVAVLKPMVDELGPRLNAYIRFLSNKQRKTVQPSSSPPSQVSHVHE